MQVSVRRQEESPMGSPNEILSSGSSEQYLKLTMNHKSNVNKETHANKKANFSS